MKVLYFLLFTSVLLLCVYSESIIVNTKYGPVRGTKDKMSTNFLGIPYATPPVGNLRWSDPIPPRPWQSPLEVTEYAPACPQICELPPKTCPDVQDEDCLYLHVYGPAVSKKLQPVLVYFHGGRFEQGTGGNILYDGKFIANMTESVVVVVNYRLGALGALAYGELNGNYAINDQRLAMRWVRENIQQFGGDSKQVTIFGQSAGAGSIAAHLISDKSNGLFDQAILQSNPFQLPFKTKETYQKLADSLAQELGCPSLDVQCLRSKTAEEVVVAQKKAEAGGIDFDIPFNSIMAWVPTLSDDDITMQPFEAMRKGLTKKIPIMQGVTSEEAILFIHLGLENPLHELGYHALVYSLFGEEYHEVIARYPSQSEDNRDNLAVLGDDLIFLCPHLNISTSLVTKNFPSIYMYVYNHTLSFDGWGPNLGFCLDRTCHGAELPILFNTAQSAGFDVSPDEIRIGREMVAYWGNFARTGNPNAGILPVPLKWEPYSAAKQETLFFHTKNVEMRYNYRKLECQYWDTVGYRWGW